MTDRGRTLPQGKPLSGKARQRAPSGDQSLEVAIGQALRDFRRKRRMTVADLAALTGLSVGMLSKIENGNTSPSLTTLQVLSRALSIPVTAFFRGYEEPRAAQHVKAGRHVEVERGTSRPGLRYNLLGDIGPNGSGVVMEPHIVTLSTRADSFPAVRHEGLELIYVLDGEVDYRHGDKVYALKPGDSLLFDGRALHGPAAAARPVRYVSVVCYPQG